MSPEQIAPRLAEVRGRVGAAARLADRDPAEVTLVAVSKTHPPTMLAAAVAAGVTDLGESYAQELTAKQDALPGLAVRWHFIGHLQRNKARQVVGRADLIHAVDSAALAIEIDRRVAVGQAQAVLVAVNLGGEAQKSGVRPAEVRDLLAGIATLARTRCEGLMTVPPQSDDPEQARPYFRALRQLRDELATPERPLAVLSMGMSGDFEVAIAEGSTLVRVGTAIFGARP